MNKLRGIKQSWIWQKDGMLYKAILYNNVFTIRTGSGQLYIKSGIILRIRGLSLESQNSIIRNMNKTKLSLESDA